MGVEAARAALRGAPRLAPAAVYFATAEPAYLDKTNATAIHAALALDESAMAFDMLGSIRSAAGALRAATDAPRPTLAVLSDIRTGLPGGADERDGGDAAAAFLMALWHRLLGRPVSETGRLCHGDGGHEGGARRPWQQRSRPPQSTGRK
jgi:3-hydroxy-3-methylglutaryl CoA synthase